MKDVCRRFRVAGLPKADVDRYIKQITPYIKSLIEQQIKELGSENFSCACG